MIKHFLSFPGNHPPPHPTKVFLVFQGWDVGQVAVFLWGCHSRNLSIKFGSRTQNLGLVLREIKDS